MKTQKIILIALCIVTFGCNNNDKEIEEMIDATVIEQEDVGVASDICWAQVVNVNKKNTCGDCSDLLDSWWKKDCKGDVCPWDSKTGYGTTCKEGIGTCGFQVGNIGGCVPAGTDHP